MTGAAVAFLDSLDEPQRDRATFAIDDESERSDWAYFPRPRNGLPLRDMDARQQWLAHRLLASGLTIVGLAKATAIESLEHVLCEVEGGAARRDPGWYFVTVFGEPTHDALWGWRYEGHHVSVHYTVVGGQVAAMPNFLGANPHRTGPIAPLAPEEDLARELLNALDSSQRADAVFDDVAPDDILTRNARRITLPLGPAGIAASSLASAPRAILDRLVDCYMARLPDPPGVPDDLSFAWAGSDRPGEGHYYRLVGRRFLIEYDNTQDGANHSHTVWRDPDGDFGADLLAQHHAQHDHLAL